MRRAVSPAPDSLRASQIFLGHNPLSERARRTGHHRLDVSFDAALCFETVVEVERVVSQSRQLRGVRRERHAHRRARSLAELVSRTEFSRRGLLLPVEECWKRLMRDRLEGTT